MKPLVPGMVLLGAFVLAGCQKQEQATAREPQKLRKTRKRKEDEIPPGLTTRVVKNALKYAPRPAVGNTVAVHYQAWLVNRNGSRGRLVDSSYVRKRPLTFTIGLSEVVRGFEIGVSLMKIGEIRQLIIAPELAYGKQGVGLFIPPNATLEFEVKLLGFS